MSFEVMVPFREALDAAASDNDVRAVIVTGEGAGSARVPTSRTRRRRRTSTGSRWPGSRSGRWSTSRISSSRCAHADEGGDRGDQRRRGGRWDVPEPRGRHPHRGALGVLPGGGHQQRSHRNGARRELPAARARSARRARSRSCSRDGDVSADEAERIGLVSRTVDDDALLDTCCELAEQINGYSRVGVALTKQVLWSALEMGSLERRSTSRTAAQLHVRLTTKNFEEAILARREGRPPVFRTEVRATTGCRRGARDSTTMPDARFPFSSRPVAGRSPFRRCAVDRRRRPRPDPADRHGVVARHRRRRPEHRRGRRRPDGRHVLARVLAPEGTGGRRGADRAHAGCDHGRRRHDQRGVGPYASAGNPAAIVTSDGGLRIFFAGLTARAPALDGVLSASAKADGQTWTTDSIAGLVRPRARSPKASAPTCEPDGTPEFTYAYSFVLGLHVGLDPATPDTDLVARELNAAPTPQPRVHQGRGGHLAWYSNVENEVGTWAQPVAPRSGPRCSRRDRWRPTARRSRRRSARPIVTRTGTEDVYLAYCRGYPTCTQVLMWKVGLADARHGGHRARRRGREHRVGSRRPALGDVGRRDRPLVARGAQQRRRHRVRRSRGFSAADWYRHDLEAAGQRARMMQLDVFTSATTPDSLATWHTNVLPGLTVDTTKTKRRRRVRGDRRRRPGDRRQGAARARRR